jgi:hypothetical protein
MRRGHVAMWGSLLLIGGVVLGVWIQPSRG